MQALRAIEVPIASNSTASLSSYEEIQEVFTVSSYETIEQDAAEDSSYETIQVVVSDSEYETVEEEIVVSDYVTDSEEEEHDAAASPPIAKEKAKTPTRKSPFSKNKAVPRTSRTTSVKKAPTSPRSHGLGEDDDENKDNDEANNSGDEGDDEASVGPGEPRVPDSAPPSPTNNEKPVKRIEWTAKDFYRGDDSCFDAWKKYRSPDYVERVEREKKLKRIERREIVRRRIKIKERHVETIRRKKWKPPEMIRVRRTREVVRTKRVAKPKRPQDGKVSIPISTALALPNAPFSLEPVTPKVSSPKLLTKDALMAPLFATNASTTKEKTKPTFLKSTMLSKPTKEETVPSTPKPTTTPATPENTPKIPTMSPVPVTPVPKEEVPEKHSQVETREEAIPQLPPPPLTPGASTKKPMNKPSQGSPKKTPLSPTKTPRTPKKKLVHLKEANVPPSPSPKDLQEAATSEVYVALKVDCHTEPTPAEYQQLAKATRDFYKRFLKSEYTQSFYDVNVQVKKTAFESNIPNDKYNIYVEWDVTAQFRKDGKGKVSEKKNDHLIIPDNYELCRALVNSLRSEYLIDHICSLEETPFAKSQAVFMEQVVKYNERKI